jgi:hypothetical protein
MVRPVHVDDDELPLFWACGVTRQAAIAAAGVRFAITHGQGSAALAISRFGAASAAVRARFVQLRAQRDLLESATPTAFDANQLLRIPGPVPIPAPTNPVAASYAPVHY